MSVRTSTTHPLRIDWLEMPSPWRVGLTIAPGKHTRARDGFMWRRDLQADLDVLAAHGVGTLVCLLEADEMKALGVAELIVLARARGLDVIHAPIRDVSVPSRADADALVRRLLERQSSIIVIHCNGGLGRSGLVAGCLLRALGMDAADTFARLRAARGPECPQTAEQRAFVEQSVRNEEF